MYACVLSFTFYAFNNETLLTENNLSILSMYKNN